ncbi:M28 family metallopeptidase [Nonomuraea sp. NPDC050663]|uniref:M28 family metallopeptidase n=1 Tax=Nonomuraea sp. NPDC050663 TaxID=3364370 RepID=UPI00378757F9
MITHAMLALALATPGISVDNVMDHLQAFQAIANAHGGNRAAGEPGYDASAAYVATRLQQAGYKVEQQPFTFPFYRELAPPVLVGKKAFPKVVTFMFSASGDVTAEPRRVGDGCMPSDFEGFEPGKIALVDRGDCTFKVKVVNATRAGAAAVVVANRAKGVFLGSLESPQRIPVVGVSRAAGEKLAKSPSVRVATSTVSEERVTHNVIAQTAAGAADDVLMVGAHLDSVKDGPGINDNGTGSATVLELALRMAQSKPKRALRFAFWGAEEEGLLGSTHYVLSLTDEELKRVTGYVNLDMVGSDNYTFGIYDGDDSARTGAGAGPKGSAEIERAFQEYFKRKRLPYQDSDFTGRSDYGPFIAAGIPAGGLFTGAEEHKSEAEAKKFGGKAGQPQDRCYHRSCDTLENVNRKALRVCAEALESAIRRLVRLS